VAAFLRRREEVIQFAEALLRQHAAARGVEEPRSRFRHGRRAVRSGTEVHRARAVVAQVDLGKRRTPPPGESGLRPTLLLQPGEDELDVLAGAEFVGGVVRARAVVVAGIEAAYRHAVAGLRLRVANAKLREERLTAAVFQHERLFAPELTPQRALPVGGGKIDRPMGARELRFLDGPLGSGLSFHC
jgi:hypothetical protein